MFGCRTAIGVGSFALVLGVAFGCGGATEHSVDPNEPAPGAGRPNQPNGRSGSSAGGSSSTAGKPTVAGAANAGSATMPDGGLIDPPPVDAGCPEQDLPAPSTQCDPFSAGACGPGAGCYPFVDHPEGSGCDAQAYGTVCLPAGVGTQGSHCGDETGDWCAPGFVCVVGQRAGKRCAAICPLGSASQCTGGLICGNLDVSGYGVCG